MDITAANLDILFRGVSNDFQSALVGTEVAYPQYATTLPMGSRQMTHAFIDRVPLMRKWFGPRVINDVVARSRTITAEPYEDTISVDKDDIADDNLGMFQHGVTMLGEAGAKWPDQLVSAFLLNEADSALGYDGVPVYSTAHPILGGTDGIPPVGAPSVQSNLLVNTALTWANATKAIAQMQSWVGPDGAPMMVDPDVIMVPPYLGPVAKQIFEAAFQPDIIGNANAPAENTLKGKCRVVVNPWLTKFSASSGTGNWWLLDTKGALKPFIFHQRQAVTMTALVSPTDANVFLNKKFLWGIDARGTASESVWWKSLAATSAAQYDFTA